MTMDPTETDPNVRGGKVPPAAYLQEITDGGPGKKYNLCGHKTLIGRNINAEIPINSTNVSRNHAFLEWTKRLGWCVTDNRSVNGVFVDSTKLKPASPHPLVSGHRICLGPPDLTAHIFEFHTYAKRPETERVSGGEVSLSSSPCKIEDGKPSCSRSLVSPRRTSKRVMQNAVKRAMSQDLSRSPTKKPCAEQPASELTLEERLAAVDSLMRKNKVLGKRVRRILNKSDEKLSESESASLLAGGRSESDSPPSPNSRMECPTQDFQQPSSSGRKKQNPRKRTARLVVSDDDDDIFVKASTSKSMPDDEVASLREKVMLLEKQLQEREEAKIDLENQLKEKETLLERQNKETEKHEQKLGNEEILQQTVNAEVANHFGKLMESEFTCSICTELFIKATTLDCAHTFCTDCLATWKKTKKQCPICRARITNSTPSIVIDGFIDKMVETLSAEDQERRKEVVKERAMPPPKKKCVTMRRTRSATARSNQMPVPNITVLSLPPPDEGPIQFNVFDTISLVNLSDVFDVEFNRDSEGDSPIETFGYYGGYGRCYNCGRPGHWANGCPEA